MLRIDVDLSGALAHLDGIAERVAEAVRPATLAGAMLIRKEVEIRAPRSEKAHWFYSRRKKDGAVGQRYLFQPGSLKKSIYIKFIPENSAAGRRAQYKISWRENSSALGYVPYAHMVEFGTVRTPAYPFLRPAYDSKKALAEALIVRAIKEAVGGKSNHSGN